MYPAADATDDTGADDASVARGSRESNTAAVLSRCDHHRGRDPRPSPQGRRNLARMDKHAVVSASDALSDVFEGAMVCVGGFGPIRNRPVDLLTALAERPRARNLTVVSNGFPHQPLAENHQVKKF